MAEFKEYPKMIYPADGGKGVIVNTKEEEAKLVASPKKADKPDKAWGNKD
jgi:hypothetical protein